jgi:hypothetical protein
MFNRAIVLSGVLAVAAAGALTGCASPADVSSAVQGAAAQVASAAEDASSSLASDAAACNRPGFNERARTEFRRDVRRDERRDIRRDAAGVAERRVENARRGWWDRAHAWWRGRWG